MKKAKKSVPYIITVFAIVGVIIALFIYNIVLMNKGENTEFFKSSCIDILTLAIGSFVIFFLTERLNDTRRRDDCIEHIITEIENAVCTETFFSTNRSALIMQASCANKIKYLKDAHFSKVHQEVCFIEQKINDIRELYSNHSSTEDELKSVMKDFEKKRIDLCDKCDKIRVLLYS